MTERVTRDREQLLPATLYSSRNRAQLKSVEPRTLFEVIFRMSVCPFCLGHEHVSRSRRTPIEKLLSLFRVFPYRCAACDIRFLRRTSLASSQKVTLQGRSAA